MADFSGGAFAEPSELLVGLRDDLTPGIASGELFSELATRLGPYQHLLYGPGLRELEVRELVACPRCEGPARGYIAFIVIDHAHVAGARAVLGTCARCGAL